MDLFELAKGISGYLARAAKGAQVDWHRDGSSMVLQCLGWQITLAGNGDQVTSTVTDPDGDSVKDLFDTPQDAADYVAQQLAA